MPPSFDRSYWTQLSDLASNTRRHPPRQAWKRCEVPAPNLRQVGSWWISADCVSTAQPRLAEVNYRRYVKKMLSACWAEIIPPRRLSQLKNLISRRSHSVLKFRLRDRPSLHHVEKAWPWLR